MFVCCHTGCKKNLTKVQHLLQGLQATGDEAQQLSAVKEMCQILVMANEDSLVGFPIKLVVPALIQLLQMEHNFEMMIHASRALTYMMEALPHSSASVVEDVSVFLKKLQERNCIDVAEQSLSALETLSKRHGKAIIQAGGISACLMYLDFFSIIAQRRALNITANCVQSMSADEFQYMRDSLSLLSARLNHSDSKAVESVCLCFARLVDNFQNDQRLLKEIAVHDLLTNIQQLLMMSPPVISTSVFITVVRMLVVMCANCPDLAVILLKQKIAETLRYLLTGSSETTDQCFELLSRTPQELYEIVSLIGELLPRLPTDGFSTVESLLRKGGMISPDGAFWQWQDDWGLYHMYTPIDNKIVEAAYQAGEEKVSLSTMRFSYLLHFNTMQQINEDTGTARPVFRKVNSLGVTGQNSAAGDTIGQTDPNVERCDSRAEILKEDQDLASSFVQTLFAVLYEVYSSSADPNIRHKCLQTIIRMIYYSPPDLLRQVFVNQSVSSHIAHMLGSPDLKVVVGALQMANILMQKLPDIYNVYFRREGVMHQIQKLVTQEVAISSPTMYSHSSGSSTVLSTVSDTSCIITPVAPRIEPPEVVDKDDLFAGGAPHHLKKPRASSAHIKIRKLSDVLKQKPPPRQGPSKKGSKSDDSGTTEASPKGVGLLLGRSSTRGKSSSGKEDRSSSSSSKIPFLTNPNPRSWGIMGSAPDRQATMKDMLAHKQMPPPLIVNNEMVKAWIKEQCKIVMVKSFSADIHGESHPALDILSYLTKVQHLLQGLQATDDEAQQLSAVKEMCQILVMGNEYSLVGFPIKLVVPALIQLLQMEHNFEMMIHASRALTYMMEALPQSSASVVEGVSVFLKKLQERNCIDVAEQSLSALETLSKRHGKAIIQAGGISACLMYLDFFSIIAQRRALNITANCVQSMSADEFHYMRDSLSLLSARLNHSDSKLVESVCLCFARLVDNFQNDQCILKEIAVHDLLTNIQQLLMMSPPVISTSVFITVVRMLVVMCANCPDLAVILLQQKITETLSYLLTGSSETTDQCFELLSRTPQELYEIVSLIGELLPRLPTDGLFTGNSLLCQGGIISPDGAFWQWQDDWGLWHMYTPIDNKIVEAAYQAGEEKVSLSTMRFSYLLDFNTMQQINEDTGTARPVFRKVNSLGMTGQNSAAGDTIGQIDPNVERCDSRAEILKEDQDLASSFVQKLFAVLYEVYSSSAGPKIRFKCLQTIIRMIYYSPPDLLRQVFVNQSVSSHIAYMLGSPDLKVVVGALQMANILMQKLPDIYSVYFRREGVMHQIQKLATQEVAISSPTKTSRSPGSSPVLNSVSDTSCIIPPVVPRIEPPEVGDGDDLFTGGAPHHLKKPHASLAHIKIRKLSDVLKQKRPPRRGSSKKGSKSDDSGTTEASPKDVGMLLGRSSTRGKSSSGQEDSSSSSKIPFQTNLNPRSWGRMGSAPDRQATMKDMLAHKQMPPPLIVNKDKVKAWIKEQCKIFMEKYFSADIHGESHPAWDMLKRLCTATKCLSLQGDSGLDCLLDIATIMRESDVSPYEVIHSGLITQLLKYLTSTSGDVTRELRIQRFLHVFLNCPPPSVTYMEEAPFDKSDTPPLLSLVSKLMACLHQLEQFQVKVHDLPGGSSAGGNTLKFFTTHQLKCQLQRHPSCTTLKQWKGGPVKIDPLALVQAIEKYLLVRGFGKTRQGADKKLSDDDNSDKEMEEQMASIMISATSPRHRLEFLIKDHVLAYNMTVYEAVKQFVCHGGTEVGDFSDGDTDSLFGNTSIWVQTHTIWYRPATEQEENMATSPKKTKAESKISKSSKKKDSRASSPVTQPVLQSFLSDKLPPTVTVQDPSLETIALLRVLHALNRHWSSMYDISFLPNEILPATEFISSKLTAKANRQLQDPLIIMTGNLPNWLPQIGQAAPFLLPFDTRQMLFFATTFDRDRAVLKLQQDQAGESSTHDIERVGLRLDRKRREVSRKEILKQAEKVMEDMGGYTNASTMLEIHYENEVGTGLGPTLEFYALVSKELQRTDLELWRGDSIAATSPADPNVKVEYTQSACGLFPLPLHCNSKAEHVNKVMAKFKFLGKFMAKALMDSRMIDLPLSRVFYKWILAQENSLCTSDLYHVDRVLACSFQPLENLVHQKKQICSDKGLSEEEKKHKISSLTMDGTSLEDLDLYFVLPGNENIELCKGGRDIQVILDNLEEYLQLVMHWTLVEGINKQFEAFRDGFESLYPLSTLQCFYPEELEQLFCGNIADVWDVRMLMDCCRPDHGYTHDSQAVKFLFEVLSSYNTTEQRDFLQFITGSPRLPVGGFKSLNPPMTVVRKQPEGTDDPDSYLPSVMTCVNYLKLPEYSSIEVMRERLSKAAKEGQLSFHLS